MMILKEEDKPSKMNQIKAMVNKMKDMSKKELSAMYNNMHKDEVEDSEEGRILD